ncbi:hypothetical protein FRC00_007186 [Tulasnella sp. 408]|nr:hypothetical protein FRC00_007186 [Tulasnella sp. 408]
MVPEGPRSLCMYCDNISRNIPQKWNKHNLFLFTPAGLPQVHVHHEYNVHFLGTSNHAPPTEMLKGIADQFETYQDMGISAYNAVLHEDVLVIPAVLALLGNNPMQNKLACPIGLTARLFCHVCWVSLGGKDVGVENEDSASEEGAHIPPDQGELMDVDEHDGRSECGAPSVAPSSRASVAGSTSLRR